MRSGPSCLIFRLKWHLSYPLFIASLVLTLRTHRIIPTRPLPTGSGGRGVTYAEFADGMRALAAATGSTDAALGISDRRLQRLLRHLDTDADGLINYEDFARVWRMAISEIAMGMVIRCRKPNLSHCL